MVLYFLENKQKNKGFGERDSPQDSGAILVLGSLATRSGQLSNVLEVARTEAGAKDRPCISAAGQASFKGNTEASYCFQKQARETEAR